MYREEGFGAKLNYRSYWDIEMDRGPGGLALIYFLSSCDLFYLIFFWFS